MNKTQLVNCIQAKLGEDATKKCADAALSAVLGAITDAVKGGEKVQIIGFGTFEMKTRPERTGHNPQTGKAITIPASSTLAFKPSSSFKVTIEPKKKTCAKKTCKKKK
ncbi:MAG: HU family DNA-binding protein [Akkermansia sp.]|nr:HU family DNA-binding protein [Akkermansia sp.]